MSPNESIQLQYLILRFFEGTISEDEFTILNRSLKESDSARELYFSILKVSLALKNVRYLNQSARAELDLKGFLCELGQYEHLAPAISVEESESQEPPVSLKKLDIQRAPYRLNKYSFYTALTALAATILIIATIYFIPPRFSPEPVARVLDASATEFVQDERFQGSSVLFKGVLEVSKGTLTFAMYDGTEVSLEAPASAELVDINRVLLKKGVIRAIVPPIATGFTVCTPTGSVIDYGTEFTVAVDQTGNAFIEVFKGTVELRDSSNPLIFENSQKLTVGQTGTIDTKGHITWKEAPRPDINIETRVQWNCPETVGRWTDSSFWTQGLVRGTELVAEFRANNAPATVLIDDAVTGKNKIRARRADVCLMSDYPVTIRMENGQVQLEQLWIGRMGMDPAAEGRWIMSSGELTLKGRDAVQLFIGDKCRGRMEVNGGAIEIFGGMRIGCNEAYSVDRGVVTFTDSDGTLLFNDGQLSIYGILEVAADGSSGRILLNGGQINAFDLRMEEQGLLVITGGRLILEGNKTAAIQNLIGTGYIQSPESEILVEYDEQGVNGFGSDKTIIYVKE